jgi:hypothetical protein
MIAVKNQLSAKSNQKVELLNACFLGGIHSPLPPIGYRNETTANKRIRRLSRRDYIPGCLRSEEGIGRYCE